MPSNPATIRFQRGQRVHQFIASLGAGPLKILDVGCQSGGFCGELLCLGHEPSGLEIMDELVANARRNYPGLSFMAGDASQKIPFADGFFDVVYAGEVIEHVARTDGFVNEINRVLKIGGHFVLTTPFHNRLKNVLIALFRFEQHFNPEFPHYRFYTRKSIQGVLGRRGFEVVAFDSIGRIPLLANAMFVAARKTETKSAQSPVHH